ncbi:U32 family peptidase [Candidatus Woesearchaeota archaeon]|nr:U32 family peptidase [Candidatus Woesearchaeota archaeon]
MKSKVELMAPVGSYETLAAAIKAGAGSVYFGVGKLNMRSASTVNFSLADLKKIVATCRKAGVKTYLTLNTVMYDEDLSDVRKVCEAAKKEGVSAVIASDFSVIEYARKVGLEVHTSTQANVSNIEAVKFFSKWADVIVLARELRIEQIKKICDEIKKQKIKGPSGRLVQIEVFVHGALCVSISGKCYMSLATYNKSANRGECLQNCRRAYRVIDDETGDELKIDNKYVMSPADLCTIGYLDKLVSAGVSVMKIEGRGRKAEYVYTTVKAYSEALDAIGKGTYTKEKVSTWTKELEKVFNRGFWHGGYYMGRKENEWSGVYGSKATTEKVQVGKVLNYYAKAKVGYFLLESDSLKVGDSILITGPTTGVVESKVKAIMKEGKEEKDQRVNSAGKGDKVTVSLPEKVRVNDKLFVVRKRD